MNRENTAFWESSLPLKLMDAVRDPRKWDEVLELIMAATGATGAIITLRDKQTCQIVNDVELEREYHSPLVRGFSTEAIVHYLTELRTRDPWAQFQTTYHPHRPLQMSRVCPQDSTPDRRFFDWLKSVGFEDTVVFELDRMPGYWTALNLFFPSATGPEIRWAMDFCNTHYDLLRKAWVASQTLSHTRQSTATLLERTAVAGAPTCIVGANGEFLDCNALFRDLLASDAIRLSGHKRKLSFAQEVTVLGLERWAQHEFIRHSAACPALFLVANAFDVDPIFAGKRERHWVLTGAGLPLGPMTEPGAAAFDTDTLTRQERALFNAVAGGMRLEEAGRSIRLKRSRTFEVWASVKAKLGISNAHQIRR